MVCKADDAGRCGGLDSATEKNEGITSGFTMFRSLELICFSLLSASSFDAIGVICTVD